MVINGLSEEIAHVREREKSGTREEEERTEC
jgi:hypothetical protein